MSDLEFSLPTLSNHVKPLCVKITIRLYCKLTASTFLKSDRSLPNDVLKFFLFTANPPHGQEALVPGKEKWEVSRRSGKMIE